jgi:hypothetical protein
MHHMFRHGAYQHNYNPPRTTGRLAINSELLSAAPAVATAVSHPAVAAAISCAATLIATASVIGPDRHSRVKSQPSWHLQPPIPTTVCQSSRHTLHSQSKEPSANRDPSAALLIYTSEEKLWSVAMSGLITQDISEANIRNESSKKNLDGISWCVSDLLDLNDPAEYALSVSYGPIMQRGKQLLTRQLKALSSREDSHSSASLRVTEDNGFPLVFSPCTLVSVAMHSVVSHVPHFT